MTALILLIVFIVLWEGAGIYDRQQNLKAQAKQKARMKPLYTVPNPKRSVSTEGTS
jgi:hypothetical protein